MHNSNVSDPLSTTAARHERYFGNDNVTLIEPPKGWRSIDLRELWAYRELLAVLTIRDIKVRYKQTVLGFAWAIVQPVALMGVFSLFFGKLANMPSDGYPYPIFVYAGLLPWIFFANTLTASTNSVVGSAAMLSKVYFPRLVIPLATVGAGLVDFIISAFLLFLLMAWYGVSLSLSLLAAPMLLAGVVFTALGVGTLLSALTVAYRDFRYVVPFMIQFWMFATPVVYPASLVPEGWRWFLYLNPMAGLIEAFRAVILARPFDIPSLVLSLGVAFVLFLLGIAYFEKVERRFADII
jgi:lipopolysaccharide transport system permease protein